MDILQEALSYFQQVELKWFNNPKAWGVIGALIQTLGYILFFYHCVRHDHESHPFSWVMFAFDTSLFTFMEWDASAAWYLLALPVVCSLSSWCIAILLWRRGVLGRYGDAGDWFAVIAFTNLLTAYLMLKYIGGADSVGGKFGVEELIVVANIITLISFVPIVRAAYYDRTTEHPIPWFVWTFAYFCLGISTYQTEGWYTVLMVYPAECFILHGVVALLAWPLLRKL